MKAQGKVAKRYARALFQLCPVQELENVQHALEDFARISRENRDLALALANPAVPVKARAEIVSDIAQRLTQQQIVGKFLARLLENGRLELLPQVSQIFAGLVDAYRNLRSFEITSAQQISEAERGEISERIRRDFGAEARIAWVVDPQILGGLRIKAGDILLDGSVSSRLDRIRASLTQ